MKIARDSLLGLEAYAKVRKELKPQIIAHRRLRSVSLGEHMTLQFEDERTIRYQIQEMLRAEKIDSAKGIQEELEVYNPLLPALDALSATLFIEVTEEARIREVLHRLLGIEEALFLSFTGAEVRARFEEGRTDGERLSAVQYVRFVFSDRERKDFLASRSVALEIRHPNLKARVDLPPETLSSLQADLTAE